MKAEKRINTKYLGDGVLGNQTGIRIAQIDHFSGLAIGRTASECWQRVLTDEVRMVRP